MKNEEEIRAEIDRLRAGASIGTGRDLHVRYEALLWVLGEGGSDV